jgi:hypothetical protein
MFLIGDLHLKQIESIFSKQTVRKIKGQLEIFKIISTTFVLKENVPEEVTEFSHVNLGLSRNTA